MKKTYWFLLWAFIMSLQGCQKTTHKEKTAPPAVQEVKKDASVLQFRMMPIKNLNVAEAARAFKDYLEGEGMYYPKFQDFHRAATLDNNEFQMRPTVLVVYGNPKELGHLINENQEIAYDLPFRILLYQDANGDVWLLYRDFQSLKNQYVLTDPYKIMDKYEKLLKGFEKRLNALQIKRQHEKTAQTP